MSLDVHDYDKKLVYELNNLEKAKILLSNKKHILAYKDFQLSESITVARVQRAVSLLRQMAFWLLYFGLISIKKIPSQFLL